MSDRAYLTQQEVADLVGVTDRTVRAWIARGDLRASRIRGSRLVRIRRSDVDALLSPIPSAKVGA